MIMFALSCCFKIRCIGAKNLSHSHVGDLQIGALLLIKISTQNSFYFLILDKEMIVFLLLWVSVRFSTFISHWDFSTSMLLAFGTCWPGSLAEDKCELQGQ